MTSIVPAEIASSKASCWLGSQISMVTFVSPRRRASNIGTVPPKMASVSYP